MTSWGLSLVHDYAPGRGRTRRIASAGESGEAAGRVPAPQRQRPSRHAQGGFRLHSLRHGCLAGECRSWSRSCGVERLGPAAGPTPDDRSWSDCSPAVACRGSGDHSSARGRGADPAARHAQGCPRPDQPAPSEAECRSTDREAGRAAPASGTSGADRPSASASGHPGQATGCTGGPGQGRAGQATGCTGGPSQGGCPAPEGS